MRLKIYLETGKIKREGLGSGARRSHMA